MSSRTGGRWPGFRWRLRAYGWHRRQSSGAAAPCSRRVWGQGRGWKTKRRLSSPLGKQRELATHGPPSSFTRTTFRPPILPHSADTRAPLESPYRTIPSSRRTSGWETRRQSAKLGPPHSHNLNHLPWRASCAPRAVRHGLSTPSALAGSFQHH